jgi:hypothetical protein
MTRGRPRIRRRHRGEGTIYRHGRGFCGRLWIKCATGEKKRITAFGKTEEEVRSDLLRMRIEANSGVTVKSHKESMADFLQGWLNSIKPPTIRLATHQLYEGLIRLHVVPRIGGLKLSAVSDVDVENMLADMERSGASVRRRQQARGVLHKAFKYAIRRKLIATNVCATVDKPKGDAPSHKVLTEDGAAGFLKAATIGKIGESLQACDSNGNAPGRAFGAPVERRGPAQPIALDSLHAYFGRAGSADANGTENGFEQAPGRTVERCGCDIARPKGTVEE